MLLPADSLPFSPSALPRQGTEDGDRVTHVQGLAQPARRGGVRAQHDSGGFVLGSHDLHWVVTYVRGRRDIGDHPTIRSPELQFSIRLALDLKSLLVDGSVVPSAQQG